MRNARVLLGFCALIIAGCASQPFPVGTRILTQVAHVATKDDIGRGVKVDDRMLFVPPHLLRPCALDVESLKSGDLAVVRSNVSWSSPAPQIDLGWVVVPVGVVVQPGDFVELELKPGLDNQRCTSIARVRSPAATGQECWYARSERNGAGEVLGSFDDVIRKVAESGGRPPGSASIYCKGLEQEGWKRHGWGPHDATIWRKAPTQ